MPTPMPLTREEFDSIPQSVRRTMVAQEVLDILDRNSPPLTSLTSRGSYCSIMVPGSITVPGPIDDIPAWLRENDSTCDVCAIGALLVGHIFLFAMPSVYRLLAWNAVNERTAIMNGERVFDERVRKLVFIARSEVVDLLRDHFPDEQLDQIERAFEKMEDWQFKWPNRLDRLRAVCQNIIDNGGTFNPDFSPAPAVVEPELQSAAELEREPELIGV